MNKKNNDIDDIDDEDEKLEEFDFLEDDVEEKIDISDIDEDIYDESNDESNDEQNSDDDFKAETSDFDIFFKNSTNKHKLEGKHSLERDTIFKGKVDDPESEMESSTFDNYDISNTLFEIEEKQDDNYLYKKCLTEDINEVLRTKTSLDFKQNRKKPNRQTFNDYYCLCYDDLHLKYTRSEIFVELSYYFTDNIFNMFKLLNKKNATSIIKELREKGFLNNIGNINFI